MKVIRIKILSNENENHVLSTSFCVILLNLEGNLFFFFFKTKKKRKEKEMIENSCRGVDSNGKFQVSRDASCL